MSQVLTRSRSGKSTKATSRHSKRDQSRGPIEQPIAADDPKAGKLPAAHEPSPAARKNRIWVCDFGGDNCEVGYMVTAEDPNRPIAFFDFEESLSTDMMEIALQDAIRIADGDIAPGDCHRCVPLIDYGFRQFATPTLNAFARSGHRMPP
jgi:hypothetical protein